MTNNELRDELKKVLDYPAPFEDQVLGSLLYHKHEYGMHAGNLECISARNVDTGEWEYLPVELRPRVIEVLNRCCPRHPRNGCWLPPGTDNVRPQVSYMS